MGKEERRMRRKKGCEGSETQRIIQFDWDYLPLQTTGVLPWSSKMKFKLIKYEKLNSVTN